MIGKSLLKSCFVDFQDSEKNYNNGKILDYEVKTVKGLSIKNFKL